MDAGAPRGPRWVWYSGLIAALALGATLRLIWIQDIEYKTDEAWTFEHAHRAGQVEPFPWTGMGSSVGVPNPGLSVWVFMVLDRLFHVHQPPDLARAIEVCNIAALILLCLFIFWQVPAHEREPWLWGLALLCVNPLAVLFHRKIWPPSIFPLFTLLFLVGWWRRERGWAAFVWGLIGAGLGQIQMAGFFFAGGFAGWSLFLDRQRVRWRYWLMGSAVGSIALWPWLGAVARHLGTHPMHPLRWYHLLQGSFWLRWLTEPLGWWVEYSLENDFYDYLCHPLIHGQPTYLAGAVHLLLLIFSALVVGRGICLFLRQRSNWWSTWWDRNSPTQFTVNAGLIGFGIAMTASGLPIHRHYLLVLFPLGYLWVALVALLPQGSRSVGRALLSGLCVAQLLISVSFLWYIHQSQHLINGDYGTPYAAQNRPGREPTTTISARDEMNETSAPALPRGTLR